MRGVLGLGSHATQHYLQRIHLKFQEANKEFSTCPLILYQTDFQEINPFLPNNFLVLQPVLSGYLKSVAALNISKLLLPNITLHETLDLIESPVKIVHAVIHTVTYLKNRGISGVILFGTFYTMHSSYLKSKFAEEEIDLFLPSPDDQQWIDNFRKKVYQSSETNEEVQHFQNLILKYVREYPVVIACTELSLYSLKKEPDCVDMAEIQISEFLKEI